MPKPDPTPYDISSIPVFPFVPGPLLWITVLLLVVMLFFAYWYFVVRETAFSSSVKAFDLARAELQQLGQQKLDRKVLSRASLVTRRLLGVFFDQDFAAMSANDLAETAKQSSDRPILQEVLQVLLTIEGQRYAKSVEIENRAIVNELHSKVCQLHRSMQEQA